jgi:hypothetical protein
MPDPSTGLYLAGLKYADSARGTVIVFQPYPVPSPVRVMEALSSYPYLKQLLKPLHAVTRIRTTLRFGEISEGFIVASLLT